jgi:hypothetical protein
LSPALSFPLGGRRLLGVYFEEYLKAADDEEPNTHKIKRSHVVGKLIVAFHLATEGRWFFRRSGEKITQLSWSNVMTRIGYCLLCATEQSIHEHRLLNMVMINNGNLAKTKYLR